MNILKKITTVFLVFFSLSNIVNAQPNKKIHYLSDYNSDIKKFCKGVLNGVDSDGLQITSVCGDNVIVKKFVKENPKPLFLLGYCSSQSEKLRAKHGVKPATETDCADVIQAAYDANLSGRMTNDQTLTVIQAALIVYNNNMLQDKTGWTQEKMNIIFSQFIKNDQTINLVVKGMINAGHTISKELQNSFVDYRPSAASYIATTGYVEGGLAVDKICSKKSGRNCRKKSTSK